MATNGFTAITHGVTVRVKHPIRKDGKHMVAYTFASTGRTVRALMTPEQIDLELAKHDDYAVQGWTRKPVTMPVDNVNS